MNWLKRLLHLEEPEPVEKPEPKPPVLEPCPICGRTPKPKYVYDAILIRLRRNTPCFSYGDIRRLCLT